MFPTGGWRVVTMLSSWGQSCRVEPLVRRNQQVRLLGCNIVISHCIRSYKLYRHITLLCILLKHPDQGIQCEEEPLARTTEAGGSFGGHLPRGNESNDPLSTDNGVLPCDHQRSVCRGEGGHTYYYCQLARFDSVPVNVEDYFWKFIGCSKGTEALRIIFRTLRCRACLKVR